MKKDEIYMHRCIELANLAIGSTAPNPMVGSVIVHDNRIISEGFHRFYGGQHAEASAIGKVNDTSVLKLSTLYVNLEPCAHQGKTPPCASLIAANGIPRIVVGTADPNSLVSGKGFAYLRNAGIDVKTGICENECINLNKRFFTYHILKRPLIILKWAQTSDGFIDVIRNYADKPGVNWISGETSRLLVHKWRSEEQAIMIGTNTARLDNPMLNTRHWYGNSPLRIVIDKNLTLPEKLNVFDHSVKTLVINNIRNSDSDSPVEFIKINFNDNFMSNLMKLLYEREIQSVIIEGGKFLLDNCIKSNLWDEARVFVGKKLFVNGLKAPDLGMSPYEISTVQDDELLIYRNFEVSKNAIKTGINQIGIK